MSGFLKSPFMRFENSGLPARRNVLRLFGARIVVKDPADSARAYRVVVRDPTNYDRVFYLWQKDVPVTLANITGSGSATTGDAASTGLGTASVNDATGAGSSTTADSTSSGAGTVATVANPGSGASTTADAASSGAGTVGAGGNFDAENLFFDDTLSGKQLPTLKTAGVDALPAGCTISGQTININGANVLLEQWDLSNYWVSQNGGTLTLRQSLLREIPSSGWSNLIYIAPVASIVTTIEWCTIQGAGIDSSLGSVFKQDVAGTGLSAIVPATLTWRRNRMTGIKSDGMKTSSGGLIEESYFDTAVALKNNPAAFDAAVTYDNGYGCTSGGLIYRSKVDGNIGNAPPNTTYWSVQPQHSDQVNPYIVSGSRLVIQRCYFNRSNADRKFSPAGYTGVGINNSVRLDPNNGTDFEHLQVSVLNNVFGGGGDQASYPISMGQPGSSLNYEPNIADANRITANSGGGYVYPGWAAFGHTVTNIIDYTRPVRLVVASDAPGVQFVGYKTFGFNGNAGALTHQLEGFVGGSRSFLAPNDVLVIAYGMASNTSKSINLSDADLIGKTAKLFANDTYDANAMFAARKVTADAHALLHTATGSGASSDACLVLVAAYSGVDITNPLDVAQVTATGVNTHHANPPAIAPVTPGAVIVAAGFGAAPTAALAADLAFSNPGDLDAARTFGTTRGGGSYRVAGMMGVLASGTNPAAFGAVRTNATDSWVAATFALRPAP